VGCVTVVTGNTATRRCPVVPTFVETTVRFCPDCGGDAEFERPPCEDGHGAECPEWLCTGCGSAVLIGNFPASEVPVTIEVRGAA
jgi:hypothetical protein